MISDQAELADLHDEHDATTLKMSGFRHGDSTVKLNANETIQMAPPPYDSYEKQTSPAWYNVKAWSKKKMGIVAGIIIVLLIIIIAVAVVEVRKNRYPDYTALSYSMVDNIHGTTFLDRKSVV